jgi:hypothetical protein
MIPPSARSRKDRISRAKDSRGGVGNQFAHVFEQAALMTAAESGEYE